MVPSIERVALNMQTLSQQKEKDRKSRLILKLESIEGYFEIANHNEPIVVKTMSREWSTGACL